MLLYWNGKEPKNNIIWNFCDDLKKKLLYYALISTPINESYNCLKSSLLHLKKKSNYRLGLRIIV